MFRKIVFLAVLGSCLAAVAESQAGYQFQFADSSGMPQTTFHVTVGDTVKIEVLLTETDADILGSDGLVAAGFKLTFGPLYADLPDADHVELNTVAFDFFSKTVLSTDGVSPRLAEVFQEAWSPVTSSGGEIWLATFTFHAQSAGTTALTASIIDPGSTFTATASGLVLDGPARDPDYIGPLNDGYGTIVVTDAPNVVPEPSSFVAMGGLGVMLLLGRRFRRRAAH